MTAVLRESLSNECKYHYNGVRGGQFVLVAKINSTCEIIASI